MPTTHHVGFAGEAAVASEFSIRGYVVSMPTIDLGNDLFVENHNTGQTWRIQVKTARPSAAQPNYFQFTIRETAIHAPTATVSHFVFALRLHDAWRLYVLAQPVLSNYANNGMGTLTPAHGARTFTFIFDPASDSVSCSGTQMNGHLNAWAPWPVI